MINESSAYGEGRKDPSMTEQPKKSTYFPAAQRRYDQKRAASSFCVGFRFVRGQDYHIIPLAEKKEVEA